MGVDRLFVRYPVRFVLGWGVVERGWWRGGGVSSTPGVLLDVSVGGGLVEVADGVVRRVGDHVGVRVGSFYGVAVVRWVGVSVGGLCLYGVEFRGGSEFLGFFGGVVEGFRGGVVGGEAGLWRGCVVE